MAISGARASFGLSAVGTPTRTKCNGPVTIGQSRDDLTFSDADIAYSIRAIFAKSGNTLALDLLTGSTAGSTAWTAGVAQVETATAAGTITASGNASVVVTAAGMTGSPKTISVAVTNGDTAATWAGKVRTALAADADVSALFTVSGSTTAIVLTRKPIRTISDIPIYAANDGTLNISLDNGTCTGITTASTSANTTSGTASDGVLIYDSGVDFEGRTLETSSEILGWMISNPATSEDSVAVAGNGVQELFIINPGQIDTSICSTGIATDNPYAFLSTASAEITITVIGKS